MLISVPSQVTGLRKVSSAINSIKMNWTEISGNAQKTYLIYRGGSLVGNTNEALITDTKLHSNTEYRYRVKARNNAGDGAFSAWNNLMTSEFWDIHSYQRLNIND